MRFYLMMLTGLFTVNGMGQNQLILEFVDDLTSNQFEKAYQKLDSRVQAQLPVSQFPLVWQSIIAQNGKINQVEFHCEELTSESEINFYTIYFENRTLDLQVAYAIESETISGFFLVPVYDCHQQEKYQSPSYKDESRFREEDLEIKSGSVVLNATITQPHESHRAICLFIHGSGPQDRDLTNGVNKPFKDLAIGLAVHGISSIRYDKRTYTYRDSMEEMTIEKEVINDVSNIIKYVASHPELQRKDVYLMGHSMGGMLLPKITLLNPQVKGLVFMAANVSSLEDLILRQYDYLFHLDGTLDEVEQKQLAQIKSQVRYLKDSLTTSSTPDKLPFQIPSSYWLSLKNYDPIESVKKISPPMLFLQGEQDDQVTLEEFNRWQQTLSERGDVTFKSYQDVNHLFIQDQENKPTNIPYYIVKDIIQWIKAI